MDPNSTAALAILMKGLAPVLGVLILLGMPAVIVFTVKHFKLRHRELDLEAELHGRQTQARLTAIEARLGTLETALGALVRGPSRRRCRTACRCWNRRPPPRRSRQNRIRSGSAPADARRCYTRCMYLVEGKKERWVDR